MITLTLSPALSLDARERRQVADAALDAATRKVAHILTMRRVLRRTAPRRPLRRAPGRVGRAAARVVGRAPS